MSNIESSQLDEDDTTVTTQAPTTKKKVVEKKTEEVTTEEETTEEETTSAGKLKVTTETINIRNKPSEDGELIAQAEYEDVFEIIKKEGDWYKINFNGTEGYVSAELVEEIE
ncbi:MAG: SH3 domain-containing protein [Eubacterium sp.]|nr:SH3 domain-containing protein [Eubacterium sp.]